MSLIRPLRGDRGSILPLLLGMVGLLMILLGGITSVAEVNREQRWLHQVADEAVLSASSALDVDLYYRRGAAALVPLDHEEARRRALTSLDGARVQIRHFSVDGDEVQLVLTRKVDLVWGWKREIAVEVSARARAPR